MDTFREASRYLNGRIPAFRRLATGGQAHDAREQYVQNQIDHRASIEDLADQLAASQYLYPNFQHVYDVHGIGSDSQVPLIPVRRFEDGGDTGDNSGTSSDGSAFGGNGFSNESSAMGAMDRSVASTFQDPGGYYTSQGYWVSGPTNASAATSIDQYNFNTLLGMGFTPAQLAEMDPAAYGQFYSAPAAAPVESSPPADIVVTPPHPSAAAPAAAADPRADLPSAAAEQVQAPALPPGLTMEQAFPSQTLMDKPAEQPVDTPIDEAVPQTPSAPYTFSTLDNQTPAMTSLGLALADQYMKSAPDIQEEEKPASNVSFADDPARAKLGQDAGTSLDDALGQTGPAAFGVTGAVPGALSTYGTQADDYVAPSYEMPPASSYLDNVSAAVPQMAIAPDYTFSTLDTSSPAQTVEQLRQAEQTIAPALDPLGYAYDAPAQDPELRALMDRTNTIQRMQENVLGEAANQPYDGQVAVDAVARNRAMNGYGNVFDDGTTSQFKQDNRNVRRDGAETPTLDQAITNQLLSPGQYSWRSDPDQVARVAQEMQDDTQRQRAWNAAVDAYNGVDPTSGALNYHTVDTAPSWGPAAEAAGSLDIGAHRFSNFANTDNSPYSRAVESAPLGAPPTSSDVPAFDPGTLGGARPTGLVTGEADEPSTLGALLGALNPIGTAQAAELPTGAKPAPGVLGMVQNFLHSIGFGNDGTGDTGAAVKAAPAATTSPFAGQFEDPKHVTIDGDVGPLAAGLGRKAAELDPANQNPETAQQTIDRVIGWTNPSTNYAMATSPEGARIGLTTANEKGYFDPFGNVASSLGQSGISAGIPGSAWSPNGWNVGNQNLDSPATETPDTSTEVAGTPKPDIVVSKPSTEMPVSPMLASPNEMKKAGDLTQTAANGLIRAGLGPAGLVDGLLGLIGLSPVNYLTTLMRKNGVKDASGLMKGDGNNDSGSRGSQGALSAAASTPASVSVPATPSTPSTVAPAAAVGELFNPSWGRTYNGIDNYHTYGFGPAKSFYTYAAKGGQIGALSRLHG
jgi:spore germination cell wall hydrolase CwlJ-like protein